MTEKTANNGKTNTMLPLFYQRVVPLNKDNHKDLYLEPRPGYQHTKATNSVYIAAVEFIKAAREYPIVFAEDNDKKVFPVALLGLQPDKNFFLTASGEWQADYIPAYVRRYPFILADFGSTGENGKDDSNQNNFTVCIDESFPGFNMNKKGTALFTDSGEPEQLLAQAMEFLKDYQSQVALTTVFCQRLVDSALLEPMQANIKLASGDAHTLGGFLCVNRQKLKQLPNDKLIEMFNSDELELIFNHLASLDNANRLLKHFT